VNCKLLLSLICLFVVSGLNAQECIDRLATPETKALFKNLYRLSGKKILFGHQDDPAYGVGWKYETGRSDIRDLTGEFPAVYGFDLGGIERGQDHNLDGVPFAKTRQFIREAYSRGGVITLSWHLNNPLSGGTAWDNKPGAVASILPGGEKNMLYTQWLDRVADFLGELKGSKGESIPVVLRLFHELNGGWFWWGKNQCSPEEIRRLWQFTIHYLKDQKKIHHLLFAFNTDRFSSAAEWMERYPGDEWIDIAWQRRRNISARISGPEWFFYSGRCQSAVQITDRSKYVCRCCHPKQGFSSIIQAESKKQNLPFQSR